MGDDGGGGTDSLDGVSSRRIVGASASVIFPCTIKSRRWRAVMEAVAKGCTPMQWVLRNSRYCDQDCQPSNNLCHWLKAEFVVCVNPSSTWVWVDECFFWYWLTRVVLDKRDKAIVYRCVCVYYCGKATSLLRVHSMNFQERQERRFTNVYDWSSLQCGLCKL